MENIISHLKKTCPHYKTPSRQALRNSRLDLYDWEDEPRIVVITRQLKINCRPCSERDVVRYQKLIQRGSLPPAIVLSEDGGIIDGAHRLQSLINEGFTEVLAFVGKRKN